MVSPSGRADLEEVAIASRATRKFPLGPSARTTEPPPPAASSDHPPIHRPERSSPVKSRVREICTSGSVRGGGGNVPTYSAKSQLRWLVRRGGCHLAEPGIAVHLKQPMESLQIDCRMLALAVFAVDVGRGWMAWSKDDCRWHSTIAARFWCGPGPGRHRQGGIVGNNLHHPHPCCCRRAQAGDDPCPHESRACSGQGPGQTAWQSPPLEALKLANAAKATEKPVQRVLDLITAWQAQGKRLGEMARELNRLNIRAPRGCQWHACTYAGAASGGATS